MSQLAADSAQLRDILLRVTIVHRLGKYLKMVLVDDFALSGPHV